MTSGGADDRPPGTVKAREVLLPDPRVLEAGAGVAEAASLLMHPNVRTVLVVDGDRLLGSVSKEALIAAVAGGADVRSLTVRDIYEASLTTVDANLPVQEAVHLMAEQGLERVPVVEGTRLLGVLVREHLVRRLAEDRVPTEPEST